MAARSCRRTTADVVGVDVRALVRGGLLAPGITATVTKRRGGVLVGTATVMRVADDAVLIGSNGRSERVALTYTHPPFGGLRAWFACPRCAGRVAILYPFACRTCSGLVYESQREAPEHRAIRRAQHYRGGLGGSANLMEPLPPRPWGMWDRTYRRRLAACRLADQRCLIAHAAVLDRWPVEAP